MTRTMLHGTAIALALTASTALAQTRYLARERLADPTTSSAASTPAADPEPDWSPCSGEGGSCRFQGEAVVRFGVPGRYFERTVSVEIGCGSGSFGGDPAPGVYKTCDMKPLVTPGYVHCADEGGSCTLPLPAYDQTCSSGDPCTSGYSGPVLVRYGATGGYVGANLGGTVPCTNGTFGRDPLPDQHKSCYYRRP